MLYNDAYIPPVWRVHPGDAVVVNVHNYLSEATNLHFHGLGGVAPRELRQYFRPYGAFQGFHPS
jgi:FtsP/CotA-like multicopper oxidase with cupredoxin domain